MRKALIGVGLLVAMAAVAIFLFLRRQQVVLNSAEVERMAASMLPGAKPPAGMKGVLGLHPEGLEVAIFAPSLAQAKPENLSGSDLRIIIARPVSPQPPSPQEISDKISHAQKEKAQKMDTLEKKPRLLSVGGKPYPGLESHLVLKSNGAKLRENLTILLVEKKPVVILVLGPEATFNTAARDEFLKALKAPDGPAHPSLPGLPIGHPRLPHPPGTDTPRLPHPHGTATPKLPKPPGIATPKPPGIATPKPPGIARPKPPRPPGPVLTKPGGPGGPPSMSSPKAGPQLPGPAGIPQRSHPARPGLPAGPPRAPSGPPGPPGF